MSERERYDLTILRQLVNCFVIIGILRKPVVPREPGPLGLLEFSGGSHLAKSSDMCGISLNHNFFKRWKNNSGGISKRNGRRRL